MMENLLTFLFTLMICATVLRAQTASISIDQPILGEKNGRIFCQFTGLTERQRTFILKMQKQGQAETELGRFLPEEPFKWEDGRIDALNYIWSNTSSSITLELSPASCDDIGTYRCQYRYSAANDQGLEEDEESLDLMVHPGSPNVEVLQPAGGGTVVQEGDTISVRCTASLGRPQGRIVWVVSSPGGGEEVLTPVEVGVTTAEDLSCTNSIRSTITLAGVTSAQQQISASCYVLASSDDGSNLPACQEEARCKTFGPLEVQYLLKSISIKALPDDIYADSDLTLECMADGVPAANYTWTKNGSADVDLSAKVTGGNLILTSLDIERDSGVYICTAANMVNGQTKELSTSVTVTVEVQPTTQDPTEPPTSDPSVGPSTDDTGASSGGSGGDDDETIIIVVCVVVAVLILVAIVIGVYCLKKRRSPKEIEEPPEKPYNNRSNLAFQNSQPDLVADDKKFHNNPSPNNSLDPAMMKSNEDILMYADLTYDNRPRSRKPMAIGVGDNASEYSDVNLPQV